ncbi:hypothetical protein NQ318_019308 [Aromia moschata]|uniref:Uncharacterized protein n=1 Tax=Aromia moschata TaxID=1265417 RepID=A0AAV8YBW2_9CUCU|nr:hypothetical protein NQ318_019308 [Aromia moschata]
MSKTQTYEWYKEYKAGREIVEDLPSSGRPSTSTTADNIDRIKTLVLENRHTSVGSRVRHIDNDSSWYLSDILGMERDAARLVPKELNVLQKEHRKHVALHMVSRADSEPNFMKRIITGDETWVYECDIKQVINHRNGAMMMSRNR